MLEIKSVSWRNFLSYGDYTTTLDLQNLGPCLIAGEILEESQEPTTVPRSNGAGKSTIANVLQWTLFGRTMHTHAPGDSIVNWFTGKDCWAKVEFKSGDYIIRTRNTDGKNELIYNKGGDEEQLVAETLSTLKNQQAKLNRIFKLDWELFCGSVFFNQYGKPWMEMADASRKKALERMLHIDRFAYYAKAGKTKCEVLDSRVEKSRFKLQTIESDMARLLAEKEKFTEAASNFLALQEQKRHNLRIRITAERQKLSSMQIPDIEKLKEKWVIVSQIEQSISHLRAKINELETKAVKQEQIIRSTTNVIKLWEDKAGKVCLECEQTIPVTHTDSKVQPLRNSLEAATNEAKQFRDAQATLRIKISQTEAMLVQKKPPMSILQAQAMIDQRTRQENEIKRLEESLTEITDENPYTASCKEVEENLAKSLEEKDALEKELAQNELLNRHYKYVHRAYNDRHKIKSFVCKDHIPFINSRLRHYLDALDLDIKIELDDALTIKSNLWGYEFESGGERKRTDLAFMLAAFDFHEQLYGRQCNILVLDEVDGRLDDNGIDVLIDIINNELTTKVETILIISHKNLMYNVFPREIKVKRRDRLSYIESQN